LFFAPARPLPVDGRSAAELLERACHAVRPGTVQPGQPRHHSRGPGDAGTTFLAKDVAKSSINVLIVGRPARARRFWPRPCIAPRRAPRAASCRSTAPPCRKAWWTPSCRLREGAFTGATQAKPGLLETAPGGTVFLDEIGELSCPCRPSASCDRNPHADSGWRRNQADVDVRFVSATNRNLAQAIESGGFRSDLYFRLNGSPGDSSAA